MAAEKGELRRKKNEMKGNSLEVVTSAEQLQAKSSALYETRNSFGGE